MSHRQANSDRDPSQHAWQCESLRPRRSGIEQQRITEPFILGLMGVAKNTNVWSGTIEKRSSIFRQLFRFKHDMPDRDAETIQRDDCFCRKAALFVSIDIAGHGCDGSNPPC